MTLGDAVGPEGRAIMRAAIKGTQRDSKVKGRVKMVPADNRKGPHKKHRGPMPASRRKRQ